MEQLLVSVVLVNFMVDYDTTYVRKTGGVDYDSGPYSVTFPAGNTNVSFDVRINNDKLVEYDEDFHLTIDSSSLPTGININSLHQTTAIIVGTISK